MKSESKRLSARRTFFWNKIIRVVACMFVYEDKRGGGNRYLLTTIHKNRPLYISVPLRLLSWCSTTNLFVRKGERNEWWHASTPAQGGVWPSFGGACHACSHWIQSTVCMYIHIFFYAKLIKSKYGFRVFNTFNTFGDYEFIKTRRQKHIWFPELIFTYEVD